VCTPLSPALPWRQVVRVPRGPPSGCDIFMHQEMEFERFTIALLLLRTDAPAFTEMEEAELQDAHMSHLSDLHDNGYLLAAGPVLGPPNRELRAFSILNVDAARARELNQGDPAVAPLTEVVDFLESVDRCRDSFHSSLELKGQVQGIVSRLVQVTAMKPKRFLLGRFPHVPQLAFPWSGVLCST